MVETLSELLPMELNMYELFRAGHLGKQSNFLGVPTVILHSEADAKKFAKDNAKKIDSGDLDPNADVTMLLGFRVIYSEVVPQGKFVTVYIRNPSIPVRL